MRLARPLALACVALALGAAAPARAYFEETLVGARGLALGASAAGAIADASAYYWDPAALASLRRPEVLLDYAKPFGLSDLDVGAVAVGARGFGTGWVLAWHRLGIRGTYSEDQLCAAAGRQVAALPGGHAVDVGLTFKFGRVALQPFTDPETGRTVDFGSQSKGSLDVGVRWRTPWSLDVAWIGRDLLQPRYQMIPGSGGDLLKAHQQVAGALRWNRESTITLGWSQDDGASSYDVGLEILFFDVFAIRSGVSNLSTIYQAYGSPTQLQYNGGFGVFHKGYYVDAAATTNRDLGASYRVTVRVPFGGGARP